MQLEKVTAFVTRERTAWGELLLFRHPFAGIQLPAGTVEPGESPDEAVVREVWDRVVSSCGPADKLQCLLH